MDGHKIVHAEFQPSTEYLLNLINTGKSYIEQGEYEKAIGNYGSIHSTPMPTTTGVLHTST